MIKAAAVIGANFGDEGKGLITDFLTGQSTSERKLVVRFNGGAQAGHSVELLNGTRHVFSHFGAGTFSGADSYLSEHFIANPILFLKELTTLETYSLTSRVAIHPKAIVTTPYDMYLNQLLENTRGKKRHGSCGVGINETVERNQQEKYRLCIQDLNSSSETCSKLRLIRDEWLFRRSDELMGRGLTEEEKALILSDDLLEYFLEDVKSFYQKIFIKENSILQDYDHIIFEGAQGLMLDQNASGFPHVTRSNTGIQNVCELLEVCEINHIDIYYVTRCYLTRHGAGPLDLEYDDCPFPNFEDKTNLPHDFQGILRFAPLDIKGLTERIQHDLTKINKRITKTVNLAITCLDHPSDAIEIIFADGNKEYLTQEGLIHSLRSTGLFSDILSVSGASRDSVSRGLVF